jgi:Inverse autotransporter, beta-domain
MSNRFILAFLITGLITCFGMVGFNYYKYSHIKTPKNSQISEQSRQVSSVVDSKIKQKENINEESPLTNQISQIQSLNKINSEGSKPTSQEQLVLNKNMEKFPEKIIEKEKNVLSNESIAIEATPKKIDQDNKTNELIMAGKGLVDKGIDGIKKDLINNSKSYANQEVIKNTKSFLEKYFPTVEVQFDMFNSRKATSGILILSPLSDPNDVKNTFFTQDSVYHNDNRTTVNLGLGYRRLEMDNKILLGINGFYDYEFPYSNSRASMGLEARTTVGEVNFNQYWGASGWKNTSNNFQEKSLGGTDLEVGVPLPYMNWAKVYGRGFIWYGVDGANDLKGTDLSLRAAVPILPGLAIEGGRRTFTNSIPDENFFRISYNLIDMAKSKSTEPLFNEKAYSLDSMEAHRYDKVRRENLIVKQKRNTKFTVKVIKY